jgi:molybdopterin adenylyltransferase
VLTVSDSVSEGRRSDLSGPAVAERLRQLGIPCHIEVSSDDFDAVTSLLRAYAQDPSLSAVFTTGGTGIAARDITPEATRAVIDREVPGLGEWMRFRGRASTPKAILSRGIAGTRGKLLIVNLPGSPRGAVESLDAIADLLPHVFDLLEGNTEHNTGSETPPRGVTSYQ